MTRRLMMEIISTILEEIGIVVIVLWGLPQINIRIPLWGLIIIMLAWAGYSIFTFRLGTKALKGQEVVGLSNMIGCSGEVVSPLTPEGMVKIRGEFWAAISVGGEIDKGKEVIVIGQQRLKLIVSENDGTNAPERKTG